MEVLAVFVLGTLYVLFISYLEVWKSVKTAKALGRNRYLYRRYYALESRWK